VRSEAIRRVKAALDAAGIDMPEPIYRVQLHQPGAAENPPVSPASSRDAAPDTRATRDITRQIAAEPSIQHDNLLDPAAPKE
jgi:hypothetical protein